MWLQERVIKQYLQYPRLYMDLYFNTEAETKDKQREKSIKQSPDRSSGRIEGKTYHYMHNVLRLRGDDYVRIFNNRGEYLCKLIAYPRAFEFIFQKQIRYPESARNNDLENCSNKINLPKINLFYSLFNRGKQDILIQKACELGVDNIYPLITQFSNYKEVNRAHLEALIIASIEQSEQLQLPCLHPVLSLSHLSLTPLDKQQYFVALPQATLSLKRAFKSKPQAVYNLLIGPEGGFSLEEEILFMSNAQFIPVKISPHILRAETAGIVMINSINVLAEEVN